jgi:hypothetical protein
MIMEVSMSTVVTPLAIGTVGILLLIAAVLLVATLGYLVLIRDNPRQVKVDAEHERVEEQFGIREPIDFEGDLRPPRDQAP